MKDIKISVIVPVYNLEDYIEKTVNSILDQTFQNIEIILVDDGSTDNSGLIIDRISMKDNRVKVIHQINGGVTSARIVGILEATGEWIGFVDGDDYVESDMYEVLLRNALEHNADISHCGYQMVFPTRVDYYHNTRKMVVQSHEKGLYDLLSGDYVEPGLWNKLYKASVVKSVAIEGVIDSSIRINEDLLMNYYFFKRSKVSIYYDFCPYHYVLRKGSAATSKVNQNKLYDPIRVQKLILEDVQDNKTLINLIYGRLASCYLCGASMSNPEKEPYIEEYINKCKTGLKDIEVSYFSGNRSSIDKLKYRLCLFSPTIYRAVHKLYAKVCGIDKKYEVR